MDWMRRIGFAFSGLLAGGLPFLLFGCAAKTPSAMKEYHAGQPAHIWKIEVPVLSIDGQQYSEPLYEASLEPGPHVLVVEYRTVLARYHCTFEVILEGGQTYEIIERSDRFPVYLNRIERGALFTTRPNRYPPRECTKIKRAE